jgi:hypothetical protein
MENGGTSINSRTTRCFDPLSNSQLCDIRSLVTLKLCVYGWKLVAFVSALQAKNIFPPVGHYTFRLFRPQPPKLEHTSDTVR